jgi:LuxR family maltose regulon positive regulatory protein
MATGRAATLLGLSEQIIDAVDEPTILQLVCKGEALHGLGDRGDELDRIIDHIEERLTRTAETEGTSDRATNPADPHAWESPSNLPWVRAVRARRRGDADALIELNVPSAVPSPSKALEGEIAEGMTWLEQYTDAERLLHEAQARADAIDYAPHIVHYLGLLATARAGQGRFTAAQALVDRALLLCGQHDLGQLRHTMYARLVDAWLAWLRGDVEQAESSALDVQVFVEQAADVPLSVQQAQLRSRVRWSLGDRIGAQALLDQVEVTATGWPISGHFADRIAFARARLDLLDGDPRAAQLELPDWRDRLSAGPTTMREWLLLMRLAIAADGPGVVVNEQPPPDLDPTVLHEFEWQRIRAHALDLSGERERAVDELASTLKAAGRLSIVQPFFDERQILGSLLPVAANEAGVGFPGLNTLEDAAVPRPVYVEPMTAREQGVLDYMATHLSYPEIAAELYVSTNTVKSHCKAIFRKLAVSKRSDAVARARAYGLIS